QLKITLVITSCSADFEIGNVDSSLAPELFDWNYEESEDYKADEQLFPNREALYSTREGDCALDAADALLLAKHLCHDDKMMFYRDDITQILEKLNDIVITGFSDLMDSEYSTIYILVLVLYVTAGAFLFIFCVYFVMWIQNSLDLNLHHSLTALTNDDESESQVTTYVRDDRSQKIMAYRKKGNKVTVDKNSKVFSWKRNRIHLTLFFGILAIILVVTAALLSWHKSNQVHKYWEMVNELDDAYSTLLFMSTMIFRLASPQLNQMGDYLGMKDALVDNLDVVRDLLENIRSWELINNDSLVFEGSCVLFSLEDGHLLSHDECVASVPTDYTALVQSGFYHMLDATLISIQNITELSQMLTYSNTDFLKLWYIFPIVQDTFSMNHYYSHSELNHIINTSNMYYVLSTILSSLFVLGFALFQVFPILLSLRKRRNLLSSIAFTFGQTEGHK
ncbi:hypothetical protein ADUPG1_009584, partial [Aduncisulcus paluster]